MVSHLKKGGFVDENDIRFAPSCREKSMMMERLHSFKEVRFNNGSVLNIELKGEATKA